MAKKINTVPEWFDLNNYNSFTDMSGEDIFSEVKFRQRIANNKERIKLLLFDLPSPYLPYDVMSNFIQIMKGNPPVVQRLREKLKRLNEPSEEDKEQILEKLKESVRPVDSSKPVYLQPLVDMLTLDGELQKVVNELDLKGNARADFHFSSGDFAKKKLLNRNEKEYDDFPAEFIVDHEKDTKISVNVKIGMFSNEEILTHMAKMLPLWRHQLGVEDIPIKTSRNTDIERIIDYKIIPLMDLFNWENIYDKKINRTVLFDCIYPNQDRGTSFLEGTVKPFIKTILDSNYRFIEKN
jgi:hypothetical protein